MSQVLLKLESNGVATLSICRPEALNALNTAIIRQIDAYVDQINADPSIRVLVIHSTGHFAAGADIKAMIDCDPAGAKDFAFTDTFCKIAALRVPTIAAMEGYALGGGLELALCCDLRIAAESAKMGLPEINLGIFPGAGGTVRLPKLVGSAKAKEMIFTGQTLSAQEARAIGLVNTVVADDETLAAAQKMAGKIASKAPLALQLAKKTINDGADAASEMAACRQERENWSTLFNTYDQKEGMRAFIEKRKPVYQGR